jgi:hypothetical protein
MDPWRPPTDEEYKYIMTNRATLGGLWWFVFSASIFLLLFFLIISVDIFIRALFDGDLERMLLTPLINLLPTLGVVFSVYLIVVNKRTDRNYRDRKISVAYGTVTNKRIVHTIRHNYTPYVRVGFDNGTMIEQAVVSGMYNMVRNGSRVIAVREQPFSRNLKFGIVFFPLSFTKGKDM